MFRDCELQKRLIIDCHVDNVVALEVEGLEMHKARFGGFAYDVKFKVVDIDGKIWKMYFNYTEDLKWYWVISKAVK